MLSRFPEYDAAAYDWTIVARTGGIDVALLSSLLAEHIQAREVLVQIHRKEGALLPLHEAACYVAAHFGHGNIRIADREFKSVVVVAQNGVAAGWQVVA